VFAARDALENWESGLIPELIPMRPRTDVRNRVIGEPAEIWLHAVDDGAKGLRGIASTVVIRGQPEFDDLNGRAKCRPILAGQSAETRAEVLAQPC
jgi:hypothetical protein